jgi:hypothetical protein
MDPVIAVNSVKSTNKYVKKSRQRNPNSHDGCYAAHLATYDTRLLETSQLSTTLLAHQYLNRRMFLSKDMPVIQDSAKVYEMAVALHRYATGNPDLNPHEIAMHDCW